jgi:hypothetical protein
MSSAEQPQPIKAELRAAAQAYWEQGYVIIPFRYGTDDKGEITKKPDVLEWKEWQTRPQTKQEFDALRLETADGFGLLCGVPNKDGLYPGALDYDVKGKEGKKPTEQALELGQKILRDMPVTQADETPSKGIHLNYLSRKPVTTDKTFKGQTAIEFLGLAGLIYVAPSKGYKRINDNGFTLIEDLQNTFYEILSKHGLTKKESEVKTTSIKLVRKRDSIERILQRDVKLADLLRGEFQKYNFPSRSEAEESVLVKLVMEGFNDAEINAVMADCQLGKWQEREDSYRTVSIEHAREQATKYITEKKPRKGTRKREKENEEENEKPIRHAPFMELPDGRLAEQGFDGSNVFFIVYDPSSKKVEKVTKIEFETFTLQPIDNDEVRDCTVLLPSDVLEYETEEELIREIRGYLTSWHEPPDQLSRTLDIYYGLLTYVYDLIPQLPYRRYLAPWGRGKSAWLETLGWICYRGIVLAGSDTDKSVVRKMNNWRGTALIDEADFGDSTLYAFLIKILNVGYDKKTGYYHRSDDNDPNRILSYTVFCPKLLATREKYKDLALESRCLTTIGRQNTSPIPLFRMDKFLAESQSLRNKLILWRFRKYHEIKQKAAQLEDKDIASKVYDGADNISSRVKQVILPLWLIAGDAMRQTLTDMAKTFDNLLKIEDPDYLLELQAKDAVKKIAEDCGKPEETVNIRNEVNILYEAPHNSEKVAYYEMPLNLISRTVLAQRGAKEEEITVSDMTSVSKSLRGIFEQNLGFNIRIGKKRSRVVLIPASWVSEEKPKGGLEDFV